MQQSAQIPLWYDRFQRWRRRRRRLTKQALTPGERIRTARLVCEMTQDELARTLNDKLGARYSQKDISRWENGHVTPNPALVLWIEKYASHQKRWRSRKANAAKQGAAA